MLLPPRFVFAACLTGVVATQAVAQLPVIDLAAISKLAARTGSELELRLTQGSRLEEATELRFSHPGITAEPLTDDPLPFTDHRQPRYGVFRVKVSEDVPPGRYECRAVGRHGVSNPRAFLVHGFAADSYESASTVPATPTTLTPGVVQHARAEAARVHYFALRVESGQPIRIDCLAAKLDSRMIPVMTLINSDGQIVQTSTGSDFLDPSLVVQAFGPGDYILQVHDAIYRGGPEFNYLLVVQGSGSTIDPVHPNGQSSPGQLPVAWFPNAAAGFAGMLEDALEIEETSDARTIQPPCTIKATFDSSEDEDAFEFSASAGDRLAIDLVSQRLGQPTDSRLVIQQQEPQPSAEPKWSTIANVDDSQNVGDAALRLRTTDSYTMFRAPASAMYRMTICDLDSGTALSESQDYWVDLRQPSPGFQLVAIRPFPARDANASRQHGSNLFRGGTEAIRVYCLRRDGWTGSVELSIDGLPEGVTCQPAVIAANQSRAQLTLVAAENAPSSIADIRVLGRGKIGERDVTVTAAPAVIQFGRGHGRESIRSRLATKMVVGVSGSDVAPLSISVGDGTIAEVNKGESLTLPIKLTRREGGQANCVLRPRDLPPTVASNDITINADKSEGNVVLKVPANATPGTYSLWMQAETKVKLKPNPQALQRAQAYRAQLQKLSGEAAQAEQQKKLAEAIKVADARVEAAQRSANAQEITIFQPTPHVTIRIVEAK